MQELSDHTHAAHLLSRWYCIFVSLFSLHYDQRTDTASYYVSNKQIMQKQTTHMYTVQIPESAD